MKYLMSKNSIIYKVKKEDSLASLAVKFNTSTQLICEQNRLKEDIEVGQTLFISPLKNKMRTVKPFEDIGYPFSRISEL